MFIWWGYASIAYSYFLRVTAPIRYRRTGKKNIKMMGYIIIGGIFFIIIRSRSLNEWVVFRHMTVFFYYIQNCIEFYSPGRRGFYAIFTIKNICFRFSLLFFIIILWEYFASISCYSSYDRAYWWINVFISISLKKIKIEIFYDIFIDIFYGNDDNIFMATRNSVVNE